MNIPFKIPLSAKFVKQIANFFGVEIVEKVSARQYIHTIPQQRINAWASERRSRDGIETFKNEVGFHLKKSGRDGHIYYVDDSHRVCECYYELSGVSEYDILIPVNALIEWFLPVKRNLSEVEKDEIVTKMNKWLEDSKIRAKLFNLDK
jgi:hypothetical protein